MFKETLLDPSKFCITWEQIPGRGAVEKQQVDVISNAEKASKSGKIHALGITDNPGGNPALSVELLCVELKRLGMEPLVHFACRDKNRNTIESMLYGLERSQARNLLVIAGDYPAPGGFGGTAKPVFDLDPVHVLQLTREMNQGLSYENLGKQLKLLPTSFFAGIGVSPFKKTEAELLGQYHKLRKKIAAGAQFAVTQIGFDARKLHELLLWLKEEKLSLPVITNLFVLTYPAAKVMSAGMIPGCVIPDRLLGQLAEEQKGSDKGRQARVTRTAKLYAVSKGLGCAGGHIGGHNLGYDTVIEIIERGEALASGWQDIVEEFDYSRESTFYYYYSLDEKTRLNTPAPAARPQKPQQPLSYLFAKAVHQLIFDNKSPLFPVCKAVAKRIDTFGSGKKLLAYLEHLIKVALFGCADCGDCALF
ncbi:MAG: methylenetetrahydrofolate reductase, partial [Pseudomonadota bacterium]